MAPMSHVLADICGWLGSAFCVKVLHHPLWRWLAVAAVAMLTLVASKIVGIILGRQSQRLADKGRATLLGVLLGTIPGPARMLSWRWGSTCSRSSCRTWTRSMAPVGWRV